MPEKRSVFFSEHTVRLLVDTFKNGGNLSNKVNANIDRYHEIVMAAQRELNSTFTPDEINAILTCVEPTWHRLDRALTIVNDFALIAGTALRAQGDQYSDLVRKISELPTHHILCLVEAIETNHKNK